MCEAQHHPWGLSEGLDHPEHPNGHRYNASDAPDVRHQENASDSEWRR